MRTYADRATFALGNVEVFTVQLGTLSLGAEGDPTSALTQPTWVHAVHFSLRVLLPIMDTLWRDYNGRKKQKQKSGRGMKVLNAFLSLRVGHCVPSGVLYIQRDERTDLLFGTR